jgi:AhpC/TSA family
VTVRECEPPVARDQRDAECLSERDEGGVVGAEVLLLPDQDGREVKLSDFGGEPVVVDFYPKAETPGSVRSNPT